MSRSIGSSKMLCAGTSPGTVSGSASYTVGSKQCIGTPLRYCIGFPPEFWYDIADEEGLLIQDEFPIWTTTKRPEKLEAAKIIPEYHAWMRERWNHPSVVIWDAQNESATGETGLALQAVRYLDYSNRPWGKTAGGNLRGTLTVSNHTPTYSFVAGPTRTKTNCCLHFACLKYPRLT